MDKDSFIVYIKTDDIIKKLQKMLRIDLILQIINQTDHYLKEKNKKVIGLMKDELGGQIMKEFAGLRPKTFSYLNDNNKDDKKARDTKKDVIKIKFKFHDHKNCLKQLKLKTK